MKKMKLKTKRNFSITVSFLLIVSLTIFSCNQDEFHDVSNIEPANKLTTKARFAEGVIPFTVDNVNKALSNVLDYYRKEKPEVAQKFQNYMVKTTHVYYKFTPRDSIQYSRLMEDDINLQLTTDPFEFAPKEWGDDPQEKEIPLFYAVVEASYKVPDVPYEIIADLHFTDEDKLEDIESNYDEVEFKQNLMYEARKLAGHLDDEELDEGYMDYRKGFEDETTKQGNITPRGLFGKKWRPSGTIRVEDDWLSERKGSPVYLPVYRAEVNVLKWGWLPIEKGSTDANGNFSTGTTFTKHVNYNVKFTDFHKVKVRPGNFFDIANWKSNSHKRRSLNVNFTRDTRHQFYALINNAAWDYFNRVVPVYGIYNPVTIEISGHYNDNKSNYWFGWVPFRSEVKIGGKKKDGSRKKSDEVYATVIHEITHKGHYKMDWKAFNSIAGSSAKHKLFLRESWALCVETIATNDKYGQYFNQYGLGSYTASISSPWQINRLWKTYKQYEKVADIDEYSPAFLDLIDNINQRNISQYYPQDRVSGYTLKQIETALKDSYTIGTFGNKLKLLYNNPTEQFIGDIINYSQTIINNL
jgi:hypothetical protein